MFDHKCHSAQHGVCRLFLSVNHIPCVNQTPSVNHVLSVNYMGEKI